MAPKGLGTTSKREKKKGLDWVEASVNGGVLILSLVKEAAEFAPVPFLKQAAGTTLRIVNTVQAVKENKADFQRLAEDAMRVISEIWKAYQKSENKVGWPGTHLQDAVADIVATLENILVFVEAQIERNRAVRVIWSIADGQKIKEYREKLNQAMNQFGVTSHLGIHETLNQIKKMMGEQQENIEELKEEAADKQKQRRKEQEQLEVLRAKMREEQRTEEEQRMQEMEEQKRRLRIEQLREEEEAAERSKKEKEELQRKLQDDLEREERLAKLRAKERLHLEELQNTKGSSDRNSYEDEESGEEEEDVETEDEDSEEERARLEAEAAARKAARKAKKKAEKAATSADDILRAEFARLGINPGVQSTPAQYPQSPPMASPPFGSPPFGSPPFGQYGGYSPPYMPGFPPQHQPGVHSPYQPPYHMQAPYGHMGMAGYGAPGGTMVSNSNSGNVTNSNISNVGNDSSVRIRTTKTKRR